MGARHADDLPRFDDYYQGRPPFDRSSVRFRLAIRIRMVANILSGTVDMLLPEGVSLETALDVQQRWAGTGNEVRFDLPTRRCASSIQYRQRWRGRERVSPTAVRQALYHAIDRQMLAESSPSGLAPAADSWIPLRIRKHAAGAGAYDSAVPL